MSNTENKKGSMTTTKRDFTKTDSKTRKEEAKKRIEENSPKLDKTPISSQLSNVAVGQDIFAHLTPSSCIIRDIVFDIRSISEEVVDAIIEQNFPNGEQQIDSFPIKRGITKVDKTISVKADTLIKIYFKHKHEGASLDEVFFAANILS